MEFIYTDYLWVEEVDLDEMVRLCKEENYKPNVALAEVSSGWDDEVFYAVGCVRDQIIAELERRIENESL